MLEIKTSTIYKINGIAILSPSKANPKISGIQLTAERTDDALMHKETVAYKRHIELRYDVLSQSQISTILNMVIKEPIVEYFTLTYLDPQKGNHTVTCYANEFAQELYAAIFYNGFWRNVTFNCIER